LTLKDPVRVKRRVHSFDSWKLQLSHYSSNFRPIPGEAESEAFKEEMEGREETEAFFAWRAAAKAPPR
jgi:hypothetical protein